MSVCISSFISINYLKQDYWMHFHCCTQRHFETTSSVIRNDKERLDKERPETFSGQSSTNITMLNFSLSEDPIRLGRDAL